MFVSRGIGEFEPIQEFIPDWAAVVVGLLTQLGDAWFLILLLAVLYWTNSDTQDNVLLVAGMYIAGLGLYRFLKFVFELPRPNEPLLEPELVPWLVRPLYEATAFASSYGFPSGHATSATIVYFGLATVLTVGTRRLRYVVATGLVGIVGFTRVALGVHYLVDIVVGVVVGGVILFVAFRGLDYVPGNQLTLLLFVGIITNLLYLLESAVDTDSVFSLGIALGLFAGWQLVLLARSVVIAGRPSRTVRPLVFRGGLAAIALAPLIAALEVFPLFSGEIYPLGGVVGLGTVVAVVVPVARYSESVRRVIDGLLFWLSTAVDGIRTGLTYVQRRIR